MFEASLLLAAALASAAGQPVQPEQVLAQAIAMHQAGDLEGAIREYREYLSQKPDSVEARSNLGAALARAGRFDEAIDEYSRALANNPKNPPVLLNLALAYYKTNRIPEAAKGLQEAAALVPPDRQLTLLLGSCYLRLGENKKAIGLLSPLERQYASDAAFNYQLGMALIRDKQADRGGAVIDRILRQGDSAQGRLLLGTAKLFARDYTGALVDLKKAVDLDPKLPEAHAYLGQALLGTGDTAGATQAFRQELALDATNFVANLQLGALTKQDQQYEQARLYFERALRSRPGDPGVRYELAAIDLATGSVDRARTALEELVKESPQFLEAHVTLATAYYRLKRKEDGDRERMTVQKLTAQNQAKEPGVNVQ
jgi:Flp pilus assembly protein TadD